MGMFDWFKPKNKKNVVIPSENVGPLQGLDLLRAFSTEDEPKIKDFPREKYKLYWEVHLEAIPGGYGAVVKFYSFKDGFVREHAVAKQSVSELRQEVTNLILSTMENNKV